MERIAAYNSTYPKVAVQWLNQALCFYQSICLLDSEVLRNPPLRQAVERYSEFKNIKYQMTLIIEKPATWKGLSYVLKSSILKSEIESRGLDCYVHLVYWTPQQNKSIEYSLIEAEYWLPNLNIDYDRFYIRTGVVPSTERKKAEAILIKEVLPKLIEWMVLKKSQSINSTNTLNRFGAYYVAGKGLIYQSSD